MCVYIYIKYFKYLLNSKCITLLFPMYLSAKMKMVLLKTTARGQESIQLGVIFIRLNQGQNLGVQSLDSIIYHTARPKK